MQEIPATSFQVCLSGRRIIKQKRLHSKPGLKSCLHKNSPGTLVVVGEQASLVPLPSVLPL
jgi:hypothetical protein